MSLELAIQDNTAALRELIARLTTPGAITMTAAQYVATIDAPAVVETKTAAPAVKEEPVAQPDVVLDYEKDIRPVLVKVSTTKGRDALVALLESFGATKGDQLAPAQFGDVLIAADKILGA